MRTQLLQEYYNGDEYLRKLQARAQTISECENPLNRAQIIADVFSVNPIAFIESILFLKIPEYQNSIKPFFLFEYQKKILWKLVEAEQSGEDVELLIDKLRGMGMTWLIAGYIYWRWMFTPNWSCLILSRTEAEVDDGTASPDNSIFGKIRFFIERTPPWLIPQGFASKEKKGTYTDSSLRILNPVMDTSINGSSTNSNAGRSRRYSFVFIDECFFIERFREVWRSLQSVARVKVFVSSVKQGRVAQDFKEKAEREGHYVTLSWRDHPFKDQKWYDEKMKLAEFDPEVTKEVEVDYTVNIADQYYPEIRQAQILPLEYNPTRPLYCGLDFGKQDLTPIVWFQFDGNWFDVIDGFAAKQKPVEFYVPFLNPEQPPYSREHYNESQWETLMRVRQWKKPKGYFGEQAHFNKVMPLNISIAQVLFRNGIRLICNKNAIKHEPRRHATSLMLPKMRFNENSAGAMEAYDALAQSRYSSSPAATSEVSIMKPKHDDEIADWRAAVENACVTFPIVLKSQRNDIGDNFRTDGFATQLSRYLKI